MKVGHQHGVAFHNVSLYHLIEGLKGMEPADNGIDRTKLFCEAIETTLLTQPPLLAVHSKLMRFLKDVKLSDLVLPGFRIDVPVEMVRRSRIERANPKTGVATLVAMI